MRTSCRHVSTKLLHRVMVRTAYRPSVMSPAELLVNNNNQHHPSVQPRRCWFSSNSSHSSNSSEAEEKKQRFDPTRSDWTKVTRSLLHSPGIWTPEQFVLAEQTIRWWVTTRKDNSDTPKLTLSLLQHAAAQLAKDPQLLQTDELANWYKGEYPRATHLLNAVLDTWRVLWKKGHDLPAPNKMLIQVEELETLGLPLDTRSYSLILKAAVQRSTPSCPPAPLFCEIVLFKHMLSSSRLADCRPDMVACCTVLDAWAKSRRADAAENALKLFRKVIEFHEEGHVSEAPTSVLHTGVIEALANSKTWENMEKAEEILRGIMASPFPELAPYLVTFRLVVFGWANLAELLSQNAKKPDKHKKQASEAVARGYQLLDQLRKEHFDRVDTSFASKMLYTAVRTSKTKADLELAEKMYQDLFERKPAFGLDASTLRSLIMLYARTRRPRRAMELVDVLEKQAFAMNEMSVLPSRGHYREVTVACIETGAGEQAENMLMRMLALATRNRTPKYVPDPDVTLRVLKAMSALRDAANRIDALLKVHQKTYELTKFPELQPRPEFVLRAMLAWSRSIDPVAPDRAEGWLNEMEKMHESGKHPKMMPTRFHYAAVLTALSSPGSDAESVKRGLELMRKANDDCAKGNKGACPDKAMYSAMLRICYRAGDGRTAERVYRFMLDKRPPRVVPSVSELNMVLISWLRSDDPGAEDRADSVLNYARRKGIQPDARTSGLLEEISLKKSQGPRLPGSYRS